MSEENVEVVRRLYDAIEREDPDTILDLYDSGVTADFSRSPQGELTGGGLFYHGHEGIKRMGREWNEAWADVEYTLDDVVDAGDHVITVLTYVGHGRTSGVEVRRTDYPVWTIQEGKIVRVVWLPTKEEALEAAGLSG
jgi:ketosteroid isomerase-like protein